MSSITIKSGTLKGVYSLNYSYEKTIDGDKNDVKVSCNAPIHDDLKRAFYNLIPHLALICEEVLQDDVLQFITNGFDEVDRDEESDQNKLKQKFNIQSFKVTGSGDSEGVQLSGYKLLSIGKSISISTPKIKWNSDDYQYTSELSEAVEACKIEVNEYLNGKYAPDNQLDMFGDDFENGETVQEFPESA